MEKLNEKEFLEASTCRKVSAIKLYNQRTKVGLQNAVYVADLAIRINDCINGFLKIVDSPSCTRYMIYCAIMDTLEEME